MKIETNKVVSMHYTLKNDKGETLDTSEGKTPLPYIHGTGAIIHGLEKELEGKVTGDKIDARIEPKDAYGEYSEENLKKVPKAGFQGNEELKEGMQVQVGMENGHHAIAIVSAVEGEEVTLDLNHPLAGMTLHFNVEIMDVRDAAPEELSHGHVHGPGGHQH